MKLKPFRVYMNFDRTDYKPGDMEAVVVESITVKVAHAETPMKAGAIASHAISQALPFLVVKDIQVYAG